MYIRRRNHYRVMLQQLARRYAGARGWAVFDWETTGLEVYRGVRPFSYAIGWPVFNKDGILLDIRKEVCRLDGSPSERKANWNKCKAFFADTDLIKVAHNYKFELGICKVSGMPVPGDTLWADAMLMHQCLKNLSPSHRLDYLGWLYAGYDRIDGMISKQAKALDGYQNIPHSRMTWYQEMDVEREGVLYYAMLPTIMADEGQYLDYLNEILLVQATQPMEEYGLDIHRANCQRLLNWCADELDKVQHDVFEVLGEYINLNSDKVLAQVLYKRLKVPIRKLTKSGAPSTDKDTLLAIRETEYTHPLIDLILKNRAYTKGIANIQSYLDLADDHDILHPNINTNPTNTGRESSSNPNLQNVEKEASTKNPFPVPARQCFQHRNGYIHWLPDYSGIEMRLIVAITGEPEMVQWLRQNSQADMHSPAATVFYGDIFTDPEKCVTFLIKSNPQLKKEYTRFVETLGTVTALQEFYKTCKKILRSSAKNAQFALAYGAGAYKISNTLMLPFDLGRIGYDRYRDRWPYIGHYTNSIINQVKKNGYVRTPFGRVLSVDQSKAYSGANYLIQGTAAGILKRAQVKVHQYVKINWPNLVVPVLPIHDEIVLSVSRSVLPYQDIIQKEIANLMCDMSEITVPLEVEWKRTSTTWDKARGFVPKYLEAVCT